jgi:hypothetical protein
LIGKHQNSLITHNYLHIITYTFFFFFFFRVTRTGGAVGGWDGGTPDHTLINTSFGTPLGGPNSGAFSRTRGPHDDTYKHNDKTPQHEVRG